MNFIDFLQNNLSHVLPILIAGAFAIAIVSERVRALYFVYPLKNTKAFFERITDLVMSGKGNEAVALCDENGTKPVAKVVKTALLRAHLPEDAIEQGLVLTIAECTRGLQKRTSFLATIANVATLLGLFGTIAGLIQSFAAVSAADPQQKAALLSGGIATAMNATMLGLGVAIPCMVIFSVLVSKSNTLAGEIEDAATRTIDVLKLRYYSVGAGDNKLDSTGGATVHSISNGTGGEKVRRAA